MWFRQSVLPSLSGVLSLFPTKGKVSSFNQLADPLKIVSRLPTPNAA